MMHIHKSFLKHTYQQIHFSLSAEILLIYALLLNNGNGKFEMEKKIFFNIRENLIYSS